MYDIGFTVHSSARVGQMPCLHEQMPGSEQTKGAPVYEQRQLRSSGKRAARLCEWREVNCNSFSARGLRHLPSSFSEIRLGLRPPPF